MQGLLARLLQEQTGQAPMTSPAPQPRPNAPGMPQPAQADPRFWQQPDFGMKLAIAGESLAAIGNNQVPNASQSLRSLYARRDARDDDADLEKSKAGLMSAMAGRLTPQQRAAIAAMPKEMAVRYLSQLAMQAQR